MSVMAGLPTASTGSVGALVNELQGAGQAQPQQGQQQPMVLVPAGILGSFLGGAGGGALGNFVGGLFGNPELGRTIGSTGGGVLGGLLPFSVVPVS